MTRALRAALALLGLAACGGEPRPSRTEVPNGDPEVGRLALQAHGCDYCHAIPGIEGLQEIGGPPLTAWAERRYIAGELPNRAENLILWIMDPHAVEPGTAMPNLGVAEDEARHMAAYLYTLGEPGEAAPPDTFPGVEYR